jgi:hypothetical protein
MSAATTEHNAIVYICVIGSEIVSSDKQAVTRLIAYNSDIPSRACGVWAGG